MDFFHKQSSNHNNEEISILEWVITIILTLIPCVGLIFVFIWSTDNVTSPSKKNFAKAVLIIYGLELLLAILVSVSSFFNSLLFS